MTQEQIEKIYKDALITAHGWYTIAEAQGNPTITAAYRRLLDHAIENYVEATKDQVKAA